MYKALSLTSQIEIVFDKAYESFIEILESSNTIKNQSNVISKNLIQDLFNYRKAQIKDTLIGSQSSGVELSYFRNPQEIEDTFKSLEIGEKIDLNSIGSGSSQNSIWELGLTEKQSNEM